MFPYTADDEDEDWLDSFECHWCHLRVYERPDEPATYHPYCSKECAIRAELCDRDPRRV